MVINNKELYLDVELDKRDFQVLCDMFDENDSGYTRAPIEVYIDRFEDMISDGVEEDIKENIDSIISFLDKNNIEYIEIRN